MKENILKELTVKNKSNCSLVVGAKGTGKTTFVINRKTVKDVFIIVTPKPLTKQFGNDIILSVEDFAKIDNENFINCKIVFDDCKYYINSNPAEKLTKKIIDLLLLSRHTNNEIYLIYHSLSEVNEKIFNKIDFLFLFRTITSISDLNLKIPCFSEIQTAESKLLEKSLHSYEIIIFDY